MNGIHFNVTSRTSAFFEYGRAWVGFGSRRYGDGSLEIFMGKASLMLSPETPETKPSTEQPRFSLLAVAAFVVLSHALPLSMMLVDKFLH